MFVFCLFLQYVINWLNLLDHLGNTLLLGDADETMSARIARAHKAGVAWALVACDLLTKGQQIVTCGKMTRNHCSYALDMKQKTNSREILNLSVWPPRFRTKPVNEVQPEEINLTN